MRGANRRYRALSCVLLIGAMGLTSESGVAEVPQANGWPQWGGPNRDFTSAVSGLADRWPDEGPTMLWRQPLGDGYSSIVGDSARIYTTYREGNDEIIVARKADDGETVWAHRCGAPSYEGQTTEFGQGPSATPLLLGDRVITIGFTGIMHCLKADSGEVLWSGDLVEDFDASAQYYGYSNSPIAYGKTVIVLVGGEKNGVVALDPADGEPVWKSKGYDISYAPPVLINVDGQDQLVFFTTDEVVGINPKDGSHLWSHQVVNFCRTNCTPAVWGKDNLLWAATKGVGGTRVLKLSQRDGKTKVKEVWLNRKIKVYHWTSNRIGDYVYTSSGGSNPLLAVIDINSGKIIRKQRGFGSTNAVVADGKLVLLDDSGKLALVKASPSGFEILSSTQLFDSVSWTPPSLIGKTLYARDRSQIVALDLGAKEKHAGKR